MVEWVSAVLSSIQNHPDDGSLHGGHWGRALRQHLWSGGCWPVPGEDWNHLHLQGGPQHESDEVLSQPCRSCGCWVQEPIWAAQAGGRPQASRQVWPYGAGKGAVCFLAQKLPSQSCESLHSFFLSFFSGRGHKKRVFFFCFVFFNLHWELMHLKEVVGKSTSVEKWKWLIGTALWFSVECKIARLYWNHCY